MVLQTDKWVHRIPGFRIPEFVVDRMQRFHPSVVIAWNTENECYQLLQRIGTKMEHIRLLRRIVPGPKMRFTAEPPTLENTVYYLNDRHPGRFQSQEDVDSWMRDTDEKNEAPDPSRINASESSIAEGADRIWHAMGKRKSFVLNPSKADGPTTHSREAGRAGPAAGG